MAAENANPKPFNISDGYTLNAPQRNTIIDWVTSIPYLLTLQLRASSHGVHEVSLYVVQMFATVALQASFIRS